MSTHKPHIDLRPTLRIDSNGTILEVSGLWPVFLLKIAHDTLLNKNHEECFSEIGKKALSQAIAEYQSPYPTLFKSSTKGMFRFIADLNMHGDWHIILQEYQSDQTSLENTDWENNNERLRLLMKATQSGVYDRDIAHGKIWRNDAFYRILGYQPKQFSNATNWWISLIKREERSTIEKAIKRIIEHKQEQFVLEYQAKANTGQYRNLLDKGHIEYDTHGNAVRITGVISDITASKEAELLLRESEKKFASVFSGAPVSIMIFCLADGNILEVNEHFLQTLGFSSKQEVVGKCASNLKIWKDLRAYRRIVKKLEKHQEIEKEKILLTGKHKALMHIRVYGKTLLLQGVTHAVLILHNTTEYVQAEQALLEKEARFKGIFENAGIGIVMTNLVGRILEANTFLTDMLGYTKEELSQKTVFSLLPQQQRRDQKKHFLKIVKEREQRLSEIEVEFKHKNGHTVWGQFRISLIWGTGKRPIYAIAMIEDISERKQAEAQAQESQELLKTINNNINDGIFRSAIEQGVVYANQAFIDMLGYGSFESMQQVPTMKMYKDPSQQSLLLEKLNRDGFLRNEEVLLQRKDGTSFWALFNCLVSIKEKGISYFDGAIVDISEQKKAKDLLQQQNEELEKINAELDSFVYSASHDLRAPLTSLLGLLQVIRMFNTDDQLLQYFDMMEKSITKLDLFIREIVNYSRNTRADIVCELIDFQETIENTCHQLQYIQGADKIDLIVEVKQQIEYYSDPNRLVPILSNLIANAIHYHKFNQDYLYIKISVETYASHALIIIEDNGIGIEAVHLDHIFEMFYRASEEAKGSGLGLYIVKETLEKLGGNISVQSKVNKGTTFTCQIPNMNAL